MIYDFPEPSSPISQGDIFIGVPILDLPEDELPIINDKGIAQMLPWETFVSAGEKVSAIIAVRPTIAIVGTQECDALRAPNITLFEVRPFRDVERKSRDTSKASKWVPLITQHARVNQKWFYLPEDERVGFSEKMGADFLTPIRIPRIALERLISFRKGRLNEVAKQHFRERLAEFFRRYAYDEWYPLTWEEMAEYQKNHPNAEPFPWQLENAAQHTEQNKDGKAAQITAIGGEKSRSEYEVELKKAFDDLEGLQSEIIDALQSWVEHLRQHAATLKQLGSDFDEVKATEAHMTLAADRDSFSERIERLSPAFEKSIEALDRSTSTYLSSLNPESSEHAEQVSRVRNHLLTLLSSLRSGKVSHIKNRDIVLAMRDNPQNINEKTNSAISRQAKAFDNLTSNTEDFESFGLKMIFLIDEKIIEPPPQEDKNE